MDAHTMGAGARMAVESGKIQFKKQKTRHAGVSDQSLLSKIQA
jgi:hypothetical protein